MSSTITISSQAELDAMRDASGNIAVAESLDLRCVGYLRCGGELSCKDIGGTLLRYQWMGRPYTYRVCAAILADGRMMVRLGCRIKSVEE